MTSQSASLTLDHYRVATLFQPLLDALALDGQEPEVVLMAFAEYLLQRLKSPYGLEFSTWEELNHVYFYNVVSTTLVRERFIALEESITTTLSMIYDTHKDDPFTYISGYWENNHPVLVFERQRDRLQFA